MSRPEPPVVGMPFHRRVDIIDEQAMRTCAELMGAGDGRAPLSLAFVLALRALIESGALPDGAVMVGHRARWASPPRPGPVTTEVSIASAGPRGTKYRRVTIAYRSTDATGGVVVTQEQEVLWPST